VPIVTKCGNVNFLEPSGSLLIILLPLLLCPDTHRLSNIKSELQKWKTSHPYRHFCASIVMIELRKQRAFVCLLCISILLYDFFFSLYYDLQMHNYLKTVTLLHVSTLSCHPKGACNQCLTKLHKYFEGSCW